jgi:hypothetical protein
MCIFIFVASLLTMMLKDAQLFVARQLAQSGKQGKPFTCPS